MRKVRKSKAVAAKVEYPTTSGWIVNSTDQLKEDGLEDIAVQIFNEFISELTAKNCLAIKIGAGIVTVRLPGTTEYRRLALVGDEKVRIVDCYIGQKKGLIARMWADPGVILGRTEGMGVEESLTDLVRNWRVVAEGGKVISMPDLLDAFVKDRFGDTPEKIKEKVEMRKQEAIDMVRRAQEEITRREMEESMKSYGDTSWGAW